MQIKIFPIKDKNTGKPIKPMLMFAVQGVESRKRAMYHYGLALGERLVAVHAENTDRITIATTQHDLDNLTRGVIGAFQPWDYALNIMFLEETNKIVATRHEDKGGRDVLILPIHIINDSYTVKRIINKAMEYATFKKIYILTPVLVGTAQTLLSAILNTLEDKITVIALINDNSSKYRSMKEYLPAFNDGKAQCSKFLLESLRRTTHTY